MNKKYELVEDDFILYKGKKLYRIRALKNILPEDNPDNNFCTNDIYKGQLGGYIEGYHNLSQKGSCWINDDAKAYGNARILDNSIIYYDAEIYGNAVIKDNAAVGEGSKVFGNAQVKDSAFVYQDAEVFGNAVVKGDARVYEKSQVYGNAMVKDVGVGYASKIYGNAVLISNEVFSNVNICDNTEEILEKIWKKIKSMN